MPSLISGHMVGGGSSSLPSCLGLLLSSSTRVPLAGDGTNWLHLRSCAASIFLLPQRRIPLACIALRSFATALHPLPVSETIPRLSAAGAASPSPDDAPTTFAGVFKPEESRLLRRLLRLHRHQMMAPMLRRLGDQYVLREFRSHVLSPTCTAVQRRLFFNAWVDYEATLHAQLLKQTKILGAQHTQPHMQIATKDETTPRKHDANDSERTHQPLYPVVGQAIDPKLTSIMTESQKESMLRMKTVATQRRKTEFDHLSGQPDTGTAKH
eukprot:GHVT01086886.1.p1 GENE.GHVT01086886.1~~GHVT01086886.1.p1  ORF type:complete len:268 (-),score=36.85 GHVT01086886.1:141-944(-)